MTETNATRAAGSSAPACSPFKYIPNWQTLDLTCTVCGTTKSVKYRMADGRVRCNLCVGKANSIGQPRLARKEG
jgi:hypothetical protein